MFAAVVCLVCAVFVSVSAVLLKTRQDDNAFLDKQRNVLIAAGLAGEDEVLTREEIQERFGPIESVVVDLQSGEELSDVDPETFDQRKATSDPQTSRAMPNNPAGIQRVPNQVDELDFGEEIGGDIPVGFQKGVARLDVDTRRSTRDPRPLPLQKRTKRPVVAGPVIVDRTPEHTGISRVQEGLVTDHAAASISSEQAAEKSRA